MTLATQVSYQTLYLFLDTGTVQSCLVAFFNLYRWQKNLMTHVRGEPLTTVMSSAAPRRHGRQRWTSSHSFWGSMTTTPVLDW